jgi:hypothetical protein
MLRQIKRQITPWANSTAIVTLRGIEQTVAQLYTVAIFSVDYEGGPLVVPTQNNVAVILNQSQAHKVLELLKESQMQAIAGEEAQVARISAS